MGISMWITVRIKSHCPHKKNCHPVIHNKSTVYPHRNVEKNKGACPLFFHSILYASLIKLVDSVFSQEYPP